LCLAGGVALNCVANGKILESKIFDSVWVQPASGDAGGSLGAALGYWFNFLQSKRIPSENDSMENSYLGPKFSESEIKKQLDLSGAKYSVHSYDEISDIVASDLADSNAIGWFCGRAEFGPRALGSRSILADPRDPNMQKNLNLKIKFRESFRPFAPVVLEEKAEQWFDMNFKKSPYMMFVHKVKKNKLIEKKEKNNFSSLEKVNEVRSQIPAVTHIDNSARIQTVNKKSNKYLYNLISKFEKKTNCPVLVNTSFNVRGEPIVNTPKEAFECFMGTNLDILVIENFYLKKKDQLSNLLTDYKNNFKPD
jgi:carbamoyltransferase